MNLIGKSNKAALKVNVSAKKEYERLRTVSLFKYLPRKDITESKYHNFIVIYKHLLDNIILCITETQLETNDDTLQGLNQLYKGDTQCIIQM